MRKSGLKKGKEGWAFAKGAALTGAKRIIRGDDAKLPPAGKAKPEPKANAPAKSAKKPAAKKPTPKATPAPEPAQAAA